MSRRVTPGGRRFDRSGIPFVAAAVLALLVVVAFLLTACRDEPARQPGATYVTPTPLPPGRPELGPGGGVR